MGDKKLKTVFFPFVDAQMAPTANTANNKTPKPTAATVRWTPSFYIEIYSMRLFDSLVLVDSYEPESADYTT